ncbi:hypothetical protein EJ05DRAFT_267273 [Pseudovirgaria hyperparasitica]|uniref:Secreted protein n=1 Tax=Pseudovirgaria hyperparasitica TaxID=470096 RepID=A0A6A6VT13_9PEZI|nr:uncharacterized protein EJ05DRAFT_267273 [Pseudovirgaria hyperparasitica]KAF2752730.1 hypothetical protein EJ05DRAFT_267273 [Pseudovirgaria hyperparasitica]
MGVYLGVTLVLPLIASSISARSTTTESLGILPVARNQVSGQMHYLWRRIGKRRVTLLCLIGSLLFRWSREVVYRYKQHTCDTFR